MENGKIVRKHMFYYFLPCFYESSKICSDVLEVRRVINIIRKRGASTENILNDFDHYLDEYL